MSYTKKTWENLPDTTTPVNSTGMNDLESRIEAGLKSINVLGLTTNEIVDEDDLNDFEDEGIYVYNAGSPTDSIFNTPPTRVFSPFKLLVISMPDYNNWASKIQLFISQWETEIFIRALDYMQGSYTWTEWQKINMGATVLDIPDVNIPSNSNLNSYTSAGTLKCQSAAIAATLSNTPYTGGAFKLIVMKYHDVSRYGQFLFALSTPNIYFRTYSANGWSKWTQIRNEGYFFQGTSNLTGSTTIDLTNYQDGKTHIIKIAMSHYSGAHYTFLEYVYRSNGTNTAFNLATSKQAGNINVTASVSGATLTINNSGSYGGTLTVIID